MHTLGQNNISIAILGPGAVGCFLAALFLKKNGFEVICIARESSVEMIRKLGIKLESKTFGNFTVMPKVVTHLDREPHILFITTKSTTLTDALKRIDPHKIRNTIIIPLLNGIEHMKVLKSNLGKNVIAASIGLVELKRISKNHVKHTTTSANIKLASNGDVEKKRIFEIAQLISSIGIDTQILESEASVLWEKLVRVNALACTTSASNHSIGQVRSDPWWRRQLEESIREAIAVAQAEGVSMDYYNIIEKIDSLPADLSTSMHRDIKEGRSSEIDAIAGAIVRAGKKNGIQCSTIERLINIIESHLEY